MNETQRTKLRTELSRMLNRTLQSIPLPVPPDEIYRACFPGQARLAKALFDLDLNHSNVAVANLLRMVQTETVVAHSLDASPNEDVHPCMTFWVEHPHLVAGCADMPLYVADPEVNRLLTPWWRKFADHEQFVDTAVYGLYAAVKLLDTKEEIEEAWPELLQAVPTLFDHTPKIRYVGGARTKRKRSRLVQQLDGVIDPPVRERIVELLAAAVLLPDTMPPFGIATTRRARR